MRRALLAAAAVLVAALLGGCGNVAADLFIVYRSGSSPGAKLTMLVDEEGGVTCNKGRTEKLLDPMIIKARTIQEHLKQPAEEGLSLKPRAGSVFRYAVRDENGTVHFADNSADQPTVLHELALFVLETAQKTCHLSE